MYKTRIVTIGLALLGTLSAHSKQTPWQEAEKERWKKGKTIPRGGWANRYELPPSQHLEEIRQGKLHTLFYPVAPTGILLPWNPILRLADWRYKKKNKDHGFMTFAGIDYLFNSLGLHPYPQPEDQGVYQVPYRNGLRPELPMGVTLVEKNGATGMTISCAACHSANLFGKSVLGMTNRFPRANFFFEVAKLSFGMTHAKVFQKLTRATDAETELYKFTQKNLRSVEAKIPAQLGLDTSLAHVALSLSRRKKDAYANPSKIRQVFPRHDPIRWVTADSKPAVWWNLKYKNRWGSDGSMVSGNPILTNLLWNDIGRGTDLAKMERWIDANTQTIQELTTAVFATEAPRYTDFFPAENLDRVSVLAGEQEFENRCAKCHGRYIKGWSQKDMQHLSWNEQIKTIEVLYHEQTPVKNVGTDPKRAKHMKSLLQLNDLQYSKKYNIVLEVQDGYVPPPLVGIWARWPYLHNNSIPSLCVLLMPEKERPKKYYSGPARDKERDFDRLCNGYPAGDRVPKAWKKSKYKFNTRRIGLSNKGHSKMVKGLTAKKRMQLIKYLQTL